MLGFEALAQALVAEGVDTVFGEIAGGVDRLSSVLKAKHGINYVKVRQEDIAIGMADGYACATGKIGVAIAGSGPGISNCGAPMWSAKMNNSRVLVIAGGQSPGADRHGNMLTDQPPFLKATIGAIQDCRTPATMSEDVALAFRHIRLGRGPIALHLVNSVMTAKMPDGWQYDPQGLSTVDLAARVPHAADVKELVEMIRKSQRPIILAGRGAYRSGAKEALMELADRCGALMTTSLFARDWFNESPYALGHSGGFGYDESIRIMKECDLVIGFGASMNDHTMSHGKGFGSAKTVQVDTNPEGLEDHRKMDKVVLGDAKETAQALLASMPKKIERPDWRGPAMAKRIKDIDRYKNRDIKEEPGMGANPRLVVEACDKLLPKDRVVSTDIGQFLGVPASYMTVQSPGDIVYNWQLGRVGCGLPIALGAAVGRPDKLVVTFLGDGGMMAGMHALDTVKSAGVPLLIIVMDNEGFESERWIFQSTGDDMWTANYDTPDLSVVAKAFGIEGYKVHSSKEMTDLLKSHDFRNKAALIQVVVDRRPHPTEMELSKGRPLPWETT